MPAPLRLRLGLLRTLVLIQLALVVLVAWSVNGLIDYDGEVPPSMVFLVTAMLAATALAFRASFPRSEGQGTNRVVFMSAEGFCALAPALAEKAFGILRELPAGVSTSGIIEGMVGLELLFASCVAALASGVAAFVLKPQPGATAASSSSRTLGMWTGAAVVVTLLVGFLYKGRYEETHTANYLLDQLFTNPNTVQQKLVAQRLIATKAAAEPGTREILFELVANGPADEKVWSAYLLLASGADDGRSMAKLRSMVGGYATLRVVEALALLGDQAAPALPELSKLMKAPTEDELGAEIHSRTAEALGRIGAPAIDAVPSLVAKLNLKDFVELRLSAALAIDQIDPTFAARCLSGKTKVLDAMPNDNSDLAIKPECLPPGVAPANSLEEKAGAQRL